MSGKRWTEHEELLLIEHVNDKASLVGRLGRSAQSVKHKASRLGVTEPASRDWTLEEETLLRSAYVDRTITNGRLIQTFQRPIGAIQAKARRLGLERKKWSQEHERLVPDLYDGSDESIEQLMALTCRSKQGVVARAGKLGLTKSPNYWTEAEDQIIRENYLVLQEEDLVSLLPNRNWDCIIQRASKLRIGSRSEAGLRPRKYHWNFDYFKEIDTGEKAYWLGFLYADGSMSDRNILRVGLVVEGQRHLRKFAQAIGYNGPIEGPYINERAGVKDIFTVALCHPIFAQHLKTKGLVPRKTWCIRFPHWLDQHLLPHFIRGVFDGDGTITSGAIKYKNKVYEYASMGICGAMKSFLENVVSAISTNVGIRVVKVVKRKNTNTHSFSYGGTPALRIRDWLYADATVWMECKKARFYSYDYSQLRPRDRRHQEELIDAEMKKRGWRRRSDYKGYDHDLLIECDKGHRWTATVRCFKDGNGCPHCHDERTGAKRLEEGAENLAIWLEQKGWQLLSEYNGNEASITLRCEHGRVFLRQAKSVKKPDARCDCARTNTIDFGRNKLLEELAVRGWQLVSEYTGCFEYVTVRCQHGNQFKRLPANIRAHSKCDCDKAAASGFRGVYAMRSGKWQARMRHNGKEINLGTFATIGDAAKARLKFLERSPS